MLLVLPGAVEKPILDADTIAAGDESAGHRRALNGREVGSSVPSAYRAARNGRRCFFA